MLRASDLAGAGLALLLASCEGPGLENIVVKADVDNCTGRIIVSGEAVNVKNGSIDVRARMITYGRSGLVWYEGGLNSNETEQPGIDGFYPRGSIPLSGEPQETWEVSIPVKECYPHEVKLVLRYGNSEITYGKKIDL